MSICTHTPSVCAPAKTTGQVRARSLTHSSRDVDSSRTGVRIDPADSA